MSTEPTFAEASTVTLRLDPDELAALDLWIVDRGETRSRADATKAALRDWLANHGYLKLRRDPEQDSETST